MTEEIGLRGRFDTSQFTKGLSTYIKGLRDAQNATTRTARALNRFGATFQETFAKAGVGIDALAPQSKAVGKALGGVKTASASGGSELQRQQTIAAALAGELRDVKKIAQARAIIESGNTSEYRKQVAAIAEQEAKLSRISRVRKLQSQGIGVSAFAPVRGAIKRLDPLSDFDPKVLKQTADLFERATAGTRKLASGLGRVKRESGAVRQEFNKLTTAGVAMGTAIGITAVAAVRRLSQAFVQTARFGLELVTFFERLGLSINFFAARTVQQADESITFNQALEQTARSAEGLLIWVQQLAIASPFTTKQVGIIFRVSQAYGLLAEEAQVLLPLLLDVGAATGLDPQTLENAARALGQIRARGKLTGEEIRQLGNAGIPIRDILVKQLKITNKEFDKILESGALISDITIPAIIESLREFEGAGERVAFQTIGGLVSAFQEIKELGLAKLFTGIFEPLRPLLEGLVETVNNPQFLAALQVLGEELGTNVANAVTFLSDGIRSLIESWTGLDPIVRRNVILFAAIAIGAVVVAGALGLIFVAVKALINPFTIVSALLAGFVVDYTTGFKTLSRLTLGFSDVVIGAFRTIGTSVTGVATFIAKVSTDVANVFSDLTDTLASLAGDAGEVWARAFGEGAISGIVSALNSINAFLFGQLKTASAPEALPDIDTWGHEIGLLFGESIGSGSEEAIQNSVNGQRVAFNKLAKDTSDGALKAYKKEEVRFINAGKQAGFAFFDGWSISQGTFKQKAPAIIDESNEPVEEAAFEAGLRVGDAYTRGFGLLFAKPQDIVNPAIAGLVNAIGGGRELTRAGAESFTGFLEGFEKADFGALEGASGIVQGFLSSLVAIGDIEEIDVPRSLFDVREELAKALKGFREFGVISSDALNAVKDAAGPLGNEIEEFLIVFQELALESMNLADAQEVLNKVTQKYNDLLDPLKDKLTKVSNVRQTAEEAREIAGLQRIVNSRIVTESRRQIAAAKIQEILTKQQIRNIEIQKKEEVGVAEEVVEGAEKQEDAAQKRFDIFKSTLSQQNSQLALVAEEAKIVETLNKELERAREKEITALERQLKFAGLVSAELADTIKAAKAKRVLEDESSSALARQRAELDLQSVALNRINRELEASKLGFDPQLLQPFRNVLVTLDDIGVKAKGTGDVLGEAFKIAAEDLPDTAKLLKDWEDSLENIKGQWGDIKDSISENLIEVNKLLPPFLKIFPEGEGGTPAILTNLKNLAKGIALSAATIQVTDFIGDLVLVGIGIKGIGAAILGTGVGGSVITLLSNMALAIGLLPGPLFIFSLALIAFRQNIGLMRDRLISWADDVFTIADRLIGIFVRLGRVISDVFSAEGRARLAEDFREWREFVTSGEGIREVVTDFKEAGDEAFDGFFDKFTTSGPLAFPITAIELGLEGLDIVTRDRGRASGEALSDGWEAALQDAAPAAQEQTSTFFRDLFSGITTSDTGEFLLGGEVADIGANIGGGIVAGIGDVPQEDISTGVELLVDSILAEVGSQAEIRSPSELFAREVGEPIGEGVALGMTRFDQSDAVTAVVTGIINQFDSLKTKGAAKFTQFNTVLSNKNKDLRRILVRETNETNETLLEGYGEFISTLVQNFDEFFFNLLEGWRITGEDSVRIVGETVDSIGTAFNGLGVSVFDGDLGLDKFGLDFVEFFTTLSTDVEPEVISVKDSIVGVLVTDEDSMLNTLRDALFGTSPTQDKTNPVYMIGVDIMAGISQGVIDSKEEFAFAMKDSIAFGFEEVATEIRSNSPSLKAAEELGLPISQGVAMGVAMGAPDVAAAVAGVLDSVFSAGLSPLLSSSPATAVPSSVSNVSTTNDFNLNVNSAQDSQGIINDFSIMRVLAAV